MQLLLDEDVPRPILRALQELGVVCKTVQETAGVGLANGEVVQLATTQNLVIVTFDKDFVPLAEKQPRCKVIFLDFSPRRAARRSSKVAKLIQQALEGLRLKNFFRIRDRI